MKKIPELNIYTFESFMFVVGVESGFALIRLCCYNFENQNKSSKYIKIDHGFNFSYN